MRVRLLLHRRRGVHLIRVRLLHHRRRRVHLVRIWLLLLRHPVRIWLLLLLHLICVWLLHDGLRLLLHRGLGPRLPVRRRRWRRRRRDGLLRLRRCNRAWHVRLGDRRLRRELFSRRSESGLRRLRLLLRLLLLRVAGRASILAAPAEDVGGQEAAGDGEKGERDAKADADFAAGGEAGLLLGGEVVGVVLTAGGRARGRA